MMEAEYIIENIRIDGYNEGADDSYRKAWDDVADVLDQAVEESWPVEDLLDTLYSDARTYADRRRPA